MLRWHPKKIYGQDEDEKWTLLKDERKDLGNNDFIKNYSGGIPINKIHKSVPTLRTGYYQVLKDDVGGDAPKDFIKMYQYYDNSKKRQNQWNKHIEKVGHKWYPLESVSEHLLNRIGEVLGLNMAKSQLRVAHGQLRFLSEYFLSDRENMIHGAQVYSAFLEENDNHFVQEIEEQNWARALLTFQFTDESVKFLFPDQYGEIMNQLVKLLVFDGITGNNDRHFYNWAIITHVEGKLKPRFSPIYDSARGLFWNINEKVIENKFYIKKGTKFEINHTKVDNYVQSSRPKIGWEGWAEPKEINHFQLISKINRYYSQHQNTCAELIKNVNLQLIYKLLDEEFAHFFTKLRLNLIKVCLKKRFEILNNLCNSDCND